MSCWSLMTVCAPRSRRAKESVKAVAQAAVATDAADATRAAATSYISTVKPLDQQANLLPAGSLPVNGSATDQLLQQPNSQKLMSTSTGAAAKKSPRGRPGLSTMGLTPGTPLMAEIEASLEFYICQRLQRWRHLEFELSGARVQVSMADLRQSTEVTSTCHGPEIWSVAKFVLNFNAMFELPLYGLCICCIDL